MMSKSKRGLLKKTVSIVLTLAMCFSFMTMPEIASANYDTGTDYSNVKADISYEFLGTSPAGTALNKVKNLPSGRIEDLVWQENGYIWVGVYLENETRQADMFGTYGLESLTAYMFYDSTCLEWSPTNASEKNAFNLISATAYPDDEGDPIYAVAGQGGTDLTLAGYESAPDFTTFETPTLTNTNKDQICSAGVVISFDSDNYAFATQHMFVGDYLVDEKTLVAIMPFKMLGSTAPAPGTKILEAALGTNTLLINQAAPDGVDGASYSYVKNPLEGEAVNLKNRLNVINKVIDLCPASANDKLSDITKAHDVTKMTYVEGNNFDPSGLELTVDMTESPDSTISGFTATNYNSPTGLGEGEIKFYIAPPETTDFSKVTPITKDTKLTKSGTTKDHVYVSYKLGNITKVADLGEITVNARQITGIVVKETSTFGKTQGKTYYTTDGPSDLLTGTNPAESLTVGLTYDNGDSEDVSYTAADVFANKNIGLYKVGSDNVLTAVLTEKFAAGNNKYCIAKASDVTSGTTTTDNLTSGSKPFATYDVTGVVADTLVIQKITEGNDNAAAKAKALSYTTETGVGNTNKIDVSAVKLSTYSAAAGAGTANDQTIAALGNKVIVYYGDAADSAYDVTKVITNGTTPYTAELTGKHILVVPADNTDATPIDLGVLKDRAIDTTKNDNTVSGITSTDKTYGDTLGDSAKITVKYDNGDTKEIAYNDFAANKITMKIGNTEVDKNTVLEPTDAAKVEFFFDHDNDPSTDPVKLGESAQFKVNKKDVHYDYDNTAPTKVYDGNKSATGGAFSLNTTDKVGEHDFDNLAVSGLTLEYDTKDVGTTHEISVKGNPSVTSSNANADAATAEVNAFTAKYNLVPGQNMTNGKLDAKGIITAKTLSVTSVIPDPDDMPTAVAGSTEEKDLKGTKTVKLTKEMAADLVEGDDVSLTYQYTFTEANAAQPTAEGATVNVSITATGDGLGLTAGADKGNYTLGTTPEQRTGKVVPKNVVRLKVTGFPTTYTYPDKKPNFSDIKIYPVYTTGEGNTPLDLSKIKIMIGEKQIDPSNAPNLDWGNTDIKFVYADDPNTEVNTQKVTEKKKPIKLSDLKIQDGAKKKWDGEASNTSEIDITEGSDSTPATIGNREDVVKVKAKYTYNNSDAGTTNVTVSDFVLEGDDADNYEIVDDEGTPINTATYTDDLGTIDNVIEPADNDQAPAKPKVEVDQKTNSIKVTEPLGDTLEYSIDGGATWQSEPTFTGLAQGTEYTVTARTKETKNVVASPASEGTTISTLNNRVRVFKKGADIVNDKPLYEGYTNKTQLTSLSKDTSEILGKSYSTLYTDNEAKTKLVASEASPYVLQAENIFYYKSTGGGGGGSSSSGVTITFPNAIEKAAVGETIKLEPTITGSTATPKWTSGDEKIATVDENGNVTIVGEGTTNIKVNVAGTTKAVTVTGTPAAATPVPTAAPVPTDKPVIDTTYTKPYASGYEDSTFRPQNNITRAELAAMIARMSNGDDIADGAYRASFPDVEADAWYSKYIGYLEGLNVLSGYEDGTFRPNNTVTRGEICSVIARAQRYDLIPYSGEFTDVTDSDWARDYIETLAKKNVVSGYEDSTFGPYSPLTRAEAVAMINRVLEPSTPVVTFRPNDVSGHWAENDVLMAVNERELANAKPTEEPQATEAPAEATEEPVATEAPAEATEEPEATEAPAAE